VYIKCCGYSQHQVSQGECHDCNLVTVLLIGIQVLFLHIVVSLFMMYSMNSLVAIGMVFAVHAKQWNNTGSGSVIFEEAISLPYPELDLTM
jgi:hypothetical protein